ncbi:MAG: flagellar basal body-associated FliL family protein [Pseudomonadota bacterium]
MTDTTVEQTTEPAKPSKLPLILGVLLAIMGGGGGYYATSTGLVFGNESQLEAKIEKSAESEESFAFVPLDPLTISLPGQGGNTHLRFRAELEVDPSKGKEVEVIRPRITDVLNGYLRALELSDLQNPASLPRLRAQMLRRVQVVAGAEKVKDLLIMEFVVN